MISKLSIFTFKRLFMLLLAGVLIHVLQDRDLWLMLVLAVFTVYNFSRKGKSGITKIYFIGFLISAVGGVLAETWGISNGLWEYHDLPDGRTFPYWLPFAWGLAFSFIYSFESYFVRVLQIESLKDKLYLTLIVSLILPVFGEIVTVNLGVWTYYGNYQILGIPLYAMALLVLFHTGTFLLLGFINSYLKTQDPVFSVQLLKRNLIKF